MIKRVKVLVMALIILSSAVGMTACGGRKEAMPDYSDDIGVKTVRFAGLTEPPPAGYYTYEDRETGTTTTNENFSTVERYAEAVEAGIDILIAHAQPGIVDGNDPDDPILAALDAAPRCDEILEPFDLLERAAEPFHNAFGLRPGRSTSSR